MTSFRLIALLAFALAFPRTAAAQSGDAGAQAGDAQVAAMHFERAAAAEKRRAWRDAIVEYERAYAAKPHPAVLYNIGRCYEELGDLRAAATYFQRYVDESPRASDRQQVIDRIAGLKNRPSRLTVLGKPAGARVFIDGLWRGKAPLEVTIGAGTHRIHIASGEKTSPVREIIVAFGEPITIALDLLSPRGHLTVDAEIAGAQVLLDGHLIGYTPFAGEVPAGNHVVVVTAPGRKPVTERVTVGAGASTSVRASFTPEVQREPGVSAVFDLGYGLNLAVAGSNRYVVGLGLRGGSRRWDLSALYGTFGDNIGSGLSAQLRIYATVTALQPYLRLGGVLGFAGDAGERPIAVEGGAGLAWTPVMAGVRAFGYYLEVNAQHELVGPADCTMCSPTETSATRFVLAAGITLAL